MPRWFAPLTVFLGTLGLIPFALIARSRVSTTDEPRIHLIRDMDQQMKFNAQEENELFGDQRAMRAPVPGTVARGEFCAAECYGDPSGEHKPGAGEACGLEEDEHLYRGRVLQGGKLAWATEFPEQVIVDEAFVRRGEGRYEVYCAPCHGLTGFGDGPIHERVQLRQQQAIPGLGGWAAPASYHTERVLNLPVGQLYNVVDNGYNNMAGYGSQIPVVDRWAIVAYVRALQRSYNPPEKR